jgi:excisionase family DNA binding protein
MTTLPVVALALDDASLHGFAELAAQHVAELLAARDGDRWMTPEEAAAYMRAPLSRIYDLTEQGKLRHAKDGRRTLIRKSWIDAYLEESA